MKVFTISGNIADQISLCGYIFDTVSLLYFYENFEYISSLFYIFAAKVANSDRGREVSLVDQNALSQAKYNIIRLLYPILDGSMLLCEFLQQYQDFYGHDCPLSFLKEQMDDVILVS